MALQCPYARNLIQRGDYLDLKDNNQFDVYLLNVSCEIFAGNMLQFMTDSIYIRLAIFIGNNVCFAILWINHIIHS